MMEGKENKTFHGKVLLFGEYSIMAGSRAALIPYRKVRAQLRIPSTCDDFAQKSNAQLRQFADYLLHVPGIKEKIDLKLFNEDLEKGMYLFSDIPGNYGLGSSGAICAAVYYRYGTNKQALSLNRLRKIFALMESFYHGMSSGADPLCVYTNETMIIESEGDIHIVDNDRYTKNLLTAFLLNTGTPSHTAPLVNHFRSLMTQDDFRMRFSENYIPLVNLSIEQWLDGKLEFSTLEKLSEAQQEFLDAMIPQSVSAIWKQGLNANLYALKLCGSGGGGMMLGFTTDFDKTMQYIYKHFAIDMLRI